MATVVAVAGACDVITGGLTHLLGQAPDLQVLPDDWSPERLLTGPVPDVVIYDVMALQHDEGAGLDTLIGSCPVAVVAAGRDLRPDLAVRALGHGAVAFVSLEAPAHEILAVIRQAAAGGAGRGVAPRLGAEARLTRREAEVLADVVKGYSNRELAERQSVSANTVKSYIRLVYRKIGVTTRAQAVSWGIRHGFQTADQHAGRQRESTGSSA
jgi:two-component system, NarL family, response regulator LiaR